MSEDYVFRKPNGEPGIYEEFHTGNALFYSKARERNSAMVAFASSEVPLFARILSMHEKLPKEFSGDFDCFEVFLGPIEISVPELKTTLEERIHLLRSLQQCDAGTHFSREMAYLAVGDAIQRYAMAFETQADIHSERTYTDIHVNDFRAYFKSFILKPLNYCQTQRGKISLLLDFERFMDTYPVDEHVKTFSQEAYKNSRSPALTYYARIFEDLKKEKYERVSDRLKKVSSRLQAV